MIDDTSLVVAVVAGVVAIVALAVAAWLAIELRRLRAAQRVLLPGGTSEDLVARQAELARSVASVEQQLSTLDALVQSTARATNAEIANSLRFRGLVRYDAYSEMGGQQSWSIGLLDEHGTGAVISCLHARDHARIYLKEIVEGAANQRLSPEEERSIAVARGTPPEPVGAEGVSAGAERELEGP